MVSQLGNIGTLIMSIGEQSQWGDTEKINKFQSNCKQKCKQIFDRIKIKYMLKKRILEIQKNKNPSLIGRRLPYDGNTDKYTY